MVVEHRLVERECACCGTRTRAEAPATVTAPLQYGPGVEALVLYLYGGQFLAKDRAAVAMAELFGIGLSPGTVAAMLARAAGRLEKEFPPQVRDALAAAGAVAPAGTAEPLRRFRHAVQIGISQTAPRSTKPMRAENALARRLTDREIGRAHV